MVYYILSLTRRRFYLLLISEKEKQNVVDLISDIMLY